MATVVRIGKPWQRTSRIHLPHPSATTHPRPPPRTLSLPLRSRSALLSTARLGLVGDRGVAAQQPRLACSPTSTALHQAGRTRCARGLSRVSGHQDGTAPSAPSAPATGSGVSPSHLVVSRTSGSTKCFGCLATPSDHGTGQVPWRQFDTIDLSDNKIVKLENFPFINRPVSLHLITTYNEREQVTPSPQGAPHLSLGRPPQQGAEPKEQAALLVPWRMRAPGQVLWRSRVNRASSHLCRYDDCLHSCFDVSSRSKLEEARIQDLGMHACSLIPASAP